MQTKSCLSYHDHVNIICVELSLSVTFSTSLVVLSIYTSIIVCAFVSIFVIVRPEEGTATKREWKEREGVVTGKYMRTVHVDWRRDRKKRQKRMKRNSGRKVEKGRYID